MFQSQLIFPLNVIHTFSPESMGLTQGGTAIASAASAAFISANRAIYIPFHLTVARLVKRLMSANGATASNNIDVGIYAAETGLPGRRIVSAGSTAQAGTDAVQYFDITDTLLGAGDYYFAVAMDGITGTLYRTAPNLDAIRRGALFQQATAFALPATAAPALPANAYLPVIGLVF